MEKKKQISTKTVVLIGMFAAILAVLAQIAIPMPSGVPVTLQTFAIALTGVVLGRKKGTIATLVYVLIGTIGVPVFSNFGAGPSVLFGKTGGFIIGFIFMTFFCGVAAAQKKKLLAVLFCVAGLAVCHLLGILQFMVLTKMNFAESALLVSVPYLIKDGASVLLAFIAGKVLKKSLNAAGILTYQEVK